MSNIISLTKRRGFIFPSSDIYGGLEGFWDYGPLGSLLKNNIKNFWLKNFVQERDDTFLIEGAIIMNPKVWQASGHIKHFTDPLIECKKCHSRFRSDLMEQGYYVGQGKAKEKNQCPVCGSKDFTSPAQFNLMFKTFVGPVEDRAHETYLRPETAQSMFTNFKNVLDAVHPKLPFGIAQIGPCFRNEITTGNFIFRSREFDVAEIEYFVKPSEDEKMFNYWLDLWKNFFLKLGLNKKLLRLREHSKDELAHYSKRTVDIEYKFPFGWSEIAGVSNRTDFDLSHHSKFSGRDLRYFDIEEKKKYFPYVIEPTLGIDRALLALLVNSYQEIKGGRTKTTKSIKEKEILLSLPKNLAPIKIAVLPLVKNKENIVKKAKDVYNLIKPHFMSEYDEKGSIGKRYRRQDEIGTPFCLTIDFQTLNDDTLTVRERDTMEQKRVKISEVVKVLKNKLEA